LRYWWVNQGDTFKAELREGILWAPLKSRNGRPVSHHVTMADVEVGDVVVHNAGSRIRALSSVAAAAVEARRPASLPAERWSQDGRLLRTLYRVAVVPPRVDDIPVDARAAEPKPGAAFDKRGRANTGYLFRLSTDLGRWIEAEFGTRFDVDVTLPGLRLPGVSPATFMGPPTVPVGGPPWQRSWERVAELG
jgi:5-methylcytosine-specific restriction protein B